MKKFLNFIRKYKLQLLLQPLYCIGIFIAIYFKTLYFHEVSGIYNEDTYFLIVSIIGCVLIFMSVIFLISFNKTKLSLLIINILVTIIIFADIMYSKYYYNPITITVVFYQFKFLNDIKDSAASLFNANNLLLFADIPIFIIMYIFIREARGIKWWLVKAFIAIIAFTTGLTYFKQAYVNSDVSTYSWEKKNMVKDLGVMYFHYDDIKNTFRKLGLQSLKLTDNELIGIQDYRYKKTNNEYTSIAENKNLLILQVEALQGFIINAEIEGQEITPNLNKLIKDNIYFDNLYFQANYGNTSDAEFIINNSLYPSKTGAVYYEYPSNMYLSIANALNQKNYYTAALHGYEADFWNRVEMYRSLGFQKYYSQNDFKSQKTIGFGISDEEFYKQSLDYLINDSKGNPFYGFMVSLSSHHPYIYFNDSTLNVGKYQGTMLGNYFKAANYADYAIGEMIKYMKDKGIYDNTVIAIYGDHAALFDDEADNLCEYLGIEYNDINWSLLQKVPLIICSKEIDKGIEINSPSGQVDILPTIANLMNIDIPYMYGRDLLNNEKGYAILPRGNIVSENFIFMIDKHKFYDLNTKQVIEETEEIIEQAREYYKKKNISSIILEKNAFKKLNSQ